MSTQIDLVTGQPTVVVVQCYLRGSGTVPSVFNATDTLYASVVPRLSTTPVFTPTPAFYTANNTLTGYDQGRVQATLTTAQMLLLEQSVRYTLIWWRSISGSPSEKEMIARMPLNIEPLAIT